MSGFAIRSHEVQLWSSEAGNWNVYITFYITNLEACVKSYKFQSNNETLMQNRVASIVREILWSWWRHQMEAFSALLALCAGNSLVNGEFPSQRPVKRIFDVIFDLRMNKRLVKKNREAGDLRCHRPHYDVTVIIKRIMGCWNCPEENIQ